MYGVELVENKSTQTPLDIPTVELIIRRCKENGLMIRIWKMSSLLYLF